VQELNGSLSVGGCRENRALVILEDGQPGCDIGGMVFPDLWCEAEVGGQEGTGKFCHQFLAGVAFVAPVLAAEIAIQAAGVPRPVGIMPISA
jgi:hypothetical protein